MYTNGLCFSGGSTEGELTSFSVGLGDVGNLSRNGQLVGDLASAIAGVRFPSSEFEDLLGSCQLPLGGRGGDFSDCGRVTRLSDGELDSQSSFEDRGLVFGGNNNAVGTNEFIIRG